MWGEVPGPQRRELGEVADGHRRNLRATNPRTRHVVHDEGPAAKVRQRFARDHQGRAARLAFVDRYGPWIRRAAVVVTAHLSCGGTRQARMHVDAARVCHTGDVGRLARGVVERQIVVQHLCREVPGAELEQLHGAAEVRHAGAAARIRLEGAHQDLLGRELLLKELGACNAAPCNIVNDECGVSHHRLDVNACRYSKARALRTTGCSRSIDDIEPRINAHAAVEQVAAGILAGGACMDVDAARVLDAQVRAAGARRVCSQEVEGQRLRAVVDVPDDDDPRHPQAPAVVRVG
mmetsp:Transcript_72261/g.202820  ORF Transcript_72261/g.202820 Transcript_72261/m.202820 type:complete len:292 (+) Transcript_72261:1159-2034(+)